jgi:hypothetical protein
MKMLSLAAVALLGMSPQVFAQDNTVAAVDADQQELVTRVSEDGQTFQIQQADGSFKTFAVQEAANDEIVVANEEAPAVASPAMATSEECANNSCLQLAHWGGGWHHHGGRQGGWGRMRWHRHWWHPHYGGWHGGWHYHHWHHGGWGGGWHHRRW